jgi:aryl carrier-like protein
MTGASRSGRQDDQDHQRPGTALAIELRQYLSERLPGYMVPEVIIELDALPLTPNRKVDVAALPDPPLTQVDSFSSAHPADEKEASVAAVWREVLGRDDFGVEDDFFRLGGNSFAVMRVLAQLRQRYGARVAVQDFLCAPTVGALARRLEVVADA